jgi:hypothetical protein
LPKGVGLLTVSDHFSDYARKLSEWNSGIDVAARIGIGQSTATAGLDVVCPDDPVDHCVLLLKSGDKVVTSSGIVGQVITVRDKTISLRSADAKMEVTKASVTEILESSSSTDS